VTDAGRTLFPETTSKAYIPDKTQTQTLLEALPAPDRPSGAVNLVRAPRPGARVPCRRRRRRPCA
jgi:hypothetical protein